MKKTTCRQLKSVSDQAREFLTANNATKQPSTIDLDNVQLLRQETLNSYEDAIDFAKDNYVGGLKTTELAGVSCLTITPREQNEALEDVVVLYFFGGGYIQGSPMEDLPISAYISNHLGVNVISPNYRLAPEFPYPAAIEDGLAVYQHLVSRISANKIVVVGESAGGNLALQVLLRSKQKGIPYAKSCVMFSPWCDLGNSGDSIYSNDGRDPTLTAFHVDNAAALFCNDIDPCSSEVSPLYANFDREFPPTLITSGSRDLLLSQCINLSRKMRSSGIDAELRVWENMWHVFEFYPTLPEAQQSLDEACQFISKHID